MELFFRFILGTTWYGLFSRSQRTARQSTLLWTLAVAVEKRLSLAPFLEALADESPGRWRLKLRGLADLLNSGASIPDALESVPGILPAETLILIRVGAESGRLGPALREAAGKSSGREGFDAYAQESLPGPATLSGLIYLCAMTLVMLNVVAFIMIWIVPKFKAIFEAFDMELPPLTETIVRVSEGGFNYVLVAVPALAILAIVSLAGASSMMGWDSTWIIPGRWLPRFFPRLQAPLVLRGLGLTVDGAYPLETALRIIAARHPDHSLRRRMAQVEEHLVAGTDCWQGLREAGLVSRGEAALLAAAQRAGNLAWALRGVADSIERRSEHRVRIIVEFLRPVGILAAGTVVGVFVVGMFLPLVKLITDYPIEGGGP